MAFELAYSSKFSKRRLNLFLYTTYHHTWSELGHLGIRLANLTPAPSNFLLSSPRRLKFAARLLHRNCYDVDHGVYTLSRGDAMQTVWQKFTNASDEIYCQHLLVHATQTGREHVPANPWYSHTIRMHGFTFQRGIFCVLTYIFCVLVYLAAISVKACPIKSISHCIIQSRRHRHVQLRNM